MTTWLLQLDEHDRRMLHALVLQRRRWVDTVMRALTHLGGATVAIGATLALLLAAPPGLATAARTAAFALAASHAVVQILKRTIGRARPELAPGVDCLIDAPDRFSFPSGHAAAALSVALPLASALPMPLGVCVVAVALLVGLSRCYLGVHYPGDVAAGWMLAVAATVAAPAALPALGPG